MKQYRKIQINKLSTNQKSKQPKIQQNKTTLVQLPLTTLRQETRWAYSATPASIHGAVLLSHWNGDCMFLFCSLAVLDPRVGHTMDVLSPFIPVLCLSDWLFHGESCPRLDVVHPGRAWPSSPSCTWHCSLHYLFLQATPLFPQHPTTQLFYRPDALPAAQPTASEHWSNYAK